MSEVLTSPLALELVSGRAPLELVIASWLAAKRSRSGSDATVQTYTTTLVDFRAALQRAGFDLDSDVRAVALVALHWVVLRHPASRREGEIPAVTHNRRLATLSSFYTFAQKWGLLSGRNPIDLLQRRRVQDWAHARVLTPQHVRRGLAAIDRSTLVGQRDCAILSMGLATGRRLSEMARICWSDLSIADESAVRVSFCRAKGDKAMADILPIGVSRAVMRYLHTAYGDDLSGLPADAPVWISFSNQHYRQHLSADGIAEISHQHLDTNFHSLRHTFAHTMEDAGAKISEIQSRLGHSSLATTGRYLAALRSAENPQAEQVAEILGLGE
jgi:site-specific recombinase XerD